MDHAAAILLSIATLLFISIGVGILSKRIKIPYTVLLVVVGLLLVPLSKLEFFGYINAFELTPHILFYVLLPILLFEAAYNMRFNKVLENFKIISLLAVVGLIISAALVAGISWYFLKMIGLEIPFIVLVLFGALISATDPVAVLALFKELGVPNRLSLVFEGESLFNDATAVAAFLVILDVIRVGTFSSHEFLHGLFMFFTMMVGGAVIGILFGLVFSKMLEYVKEDKKYQISITMLVAHVTFISAELFHLIHFGDVEIHLSPIVATVFAALVIGNYGRYKVTKEVEEYMDEFWEYFAFFANSMVFLLLGLLFASVDANVLDYALPVLIIILSVLVARVISVYSITVPFNFFFKNTKLEIPASWSYLLSWGSLRGALAIAMVLLIPENLTVPGWPLSISVHDFILIITVGCIYFTLFVKATTIPKIISNLNLDKFTKLDKIRYLEAKAYNYANLVLEAEKSYEDATLAKNIWKEILDKARKKYNDAMVELHKLIGFDDDIRFTFFQRYAIGIERRVLEEYYKSGEITEYGYKKAKNKLFEQEENIEETGGTGSFSDMRGVDIVGKIITFIKRMFFIKDNGPTDYDKLVYYRTLAHMSGEVVARLEKFGNIIFDEENDLKKLNEIKSIYEEYRRGAMEKMKDLLAKNPKLKKKYDLIIVNKVKHYQRNIIDRLHHDELLNQKTYNALLKDIDEEFNKV